MLPHPHLGTYLYLIFPTECSSKVSCSELPKAPGSCTAISFAENAFPLLPASQPAHSCVSFQTQFNIITSALVSSVCISVLCWAHLRPGACLSAVWSSGYWVVRFLRAGALPVLWDLWHLTWHQLSSHLINEPLFIRFWKQSSVY